MNTELHQWLTPYLSGYPEIMYGIERYIHGVHPGMNEQTRVKVVREPDYGLPTETTTLPPECEELKPEKHGVRFMGQDFVWAMAYSSSKNVLIVRAIGLSKVENE